MRFCRLYILHISPILKRLNLKKFLSNFSKTMAQFEDEYIPNKPTLGFSHICHQFFFSGHGELQKWGKLVQKGGKIRSLKNAVKFKSLRAWICF